MWLFPLFVLKKTKMILIADSGSTKCDWVVLTSKNAVPTKIRTSGINPAILSAEAIHSALIELQKKLENPNEIQKIYFFGAGCNTEVSNAKLQKELEQICPNALVIVKEDTMAAIWATTSEPAVVSILGTGSNCCYYNGTSIEQKIPAMGYMLMDEASGNYYGKELLRAYYFNEMPQALRILFEVSYDLDESAVIEQLYQSATPNKYLAEYARFLFRHIDEPFCQDIVKEGVEKFIKHHILPHRKELETVPLYFVGSVAYYAQSFIRECLFNHGLKASRFVKRPMDNLIQRIKNENILV